MTTGATSSQRQSEFFVEEPRDGAYGALIRAVAKLSAEFLLVVVRAKTRKPVKPPLVQMLQPWLVRCETGRKWPGGGIGGGKHVAELYYFRSSPAAAEILASEKAGLYEWRQVNGPEDLTFLDKEGRVVLATTAHECSGWIEGSSEVREVVRAAVGTRFLPSRAGHEGGGAVEQPDAADGALRRSRPVLKRRR